MSNVIAEGWLVSDSNLIYAVKGYLPSMRGYYVVPKYLEGRCIKVDRCPNEFLVYDEKLGRPACILPENRVSRIYSPFSSSKRLLEHTHLLEPYLLLESRLSKTSIIGLTGSARIGCSTPKSDLDLILYPINKPEEVYNELLLLRSEGLTLPCPDNLSEKNYHEKRISSMPLDFYLKVRRHRLLEGCIGETQYSIRILWPPNDPCLHICIPISRHIYVGELKRVSYHYTTPATYDVGNGEMKMVTWRIRYMELPEDVYRISGILYYDGRGNKVIVPDYEGSVEPVGG